MFDLDGTIVDTIDLIRESFRHASREVLGRQLPDEVLMANVGQPLMRQMQLLDADKADDLYQVYRKYNHAVHDDLIRPYPGIEDLLRELRRRGALMAIVTSKSRETVNMAFRSVPIEHFFETVVATDDTELHKPYPQPIQLAMRRLDVVPEESVYIGDSPFDIEAGQAAGVKTVAVDWGIFPAVRLKEMEPDFYFEKPDEILGLCPE
ncbi:MAG: HAD-IA family hydrolase [Actinomycetota bacterium]|nr:HAD-IA family hydrolase [Actinomycetota bacterium]